MNINELHRSASRIRTKLTQLKSADPEFKIFGADAHQYEFNSPASEEDIEDFESEHDISLPESFKEFIRSFGNGDPGEYGAAGPYYGIYELGEFGYMQIDRHSMARNGSLSGKIRP